MNTKHLLSIVFFTLVLASACKDDDHKIEPDTSPCVPAFFKTNENNTPAIKAIANQNDRVIKPQDLDFHPKRENELWVINKGVDNTGGSTLTITQAGTENQDVEWRRDGNAWHFMAFPAAMSFSQENENFATSANIQDANRNNGTFTGPSLWSSDMSIYAQNPGAGLNGSHLDMLHGSPYCLGIDADKDNAFWVLDGYNEYVTWYNFNGDHGPGHADHSDGEIYRYTEMTVTRDAEVPGHIVYDQEPKTLYVCEPAKSRILWMNTASAQIERSLPLTNEQLGSHQKMKNLEWGVFSDTKLQKPCGIEIIGDFLFVSDYETGEIVAYNKNTKKEIARIETEGKGIMGIKADKNGQLWFVNERTNTVNRIDQQ